jgi:serine/threonine protein kinase
VKPDNIMVTSEGGVKLADFGQASEIVGAAQRQLVGSPAYMAPEMARGESQPGPSVDIYALGISLFQTLTGQLPFVGPGIEGTLRAHAEQPIPKLGPSVPKLQGLDDVLARMLAKDPGKRYDSYNLLLVDLQTLAGRCGSSWDTSSSWGEALVSEDLRELCLACL